jgi:hypothetical protein
VLSEVILVSVAGRSNVRRALTNVGCGRLAKELSAMPEFSPNPNLRYVDTLEDYPRAEFMTLPAHPAQRQTELHAIRLAASGVLDTPLDQHREVAVVMIGNPNTSIDDMLAAYAADKYAALRQYARVLNGHTRRYLWDLGNGAATPDTLRLTVYVAATSEAAIQAYRAVDSLVAVKGQKDTMQSTLRVAGITPQSVWLKSAGKLGAALDLALTVLAGSREYVIGDLRKLLRREVPPGLVDEKLYGLLPHLAQVQYFKPTLAVFDELAPSARLMPMDAPFVAGYLLILLRDPEEGRQFLEKLEVETGEYAGGLMDAFYCIKKIGDVINDAEAKLKTTSGQRTDQLVACVLNAYEGWRADNDTFKADKYPVAPAVISRFNPLFAKSAAALVKAAARDKIRAKERRLAERRAETVAPAHEPRILERRRLPVRRRRQTEPLAERDWS